MSNAVLKKSNLRNYEVIPGPGTYIVKVSNSVKPEYLLEDGSKSRYIVNLRASTIDKLQECVALMGRRDTVPFYEVKKCFLSGALWDNDIDDITRLPTKGEEIIATFEMKDDELLCTALTIIPRRQLSTFDLDAYCQSRKLIKQLLK